MALDSLRFAHRFDQISGSAIREIFKMIAKPGMISFAGGNPAASALPDAECAEIARDVLQKAGVAAVMANGMPEIRALAHLVSKADCDHDGVAEILETLGI